jgi:hypothetical protein
LRVKPVMAAGKQARVKSANETYDSDKALTSGYKL